MAALAPAPYRPSPTPHPSSAPSSSSTINSAAPSKKQENSAAVAAGRRRLEEFKRKKAAEKVKKTSAVAPAVAAAAAASHQTDRISEGKQIPAIVSFSGLPSKSVESNGQVSEDFLNDDIRFVSAQGSLPSEVTISSVVHGAPFRAYGADGSTENSIRNDSHVKAVPRGSNRNGGTAISGSDSSALAKPITESLKTTLKNADAEAGSYPALDLTNTNRIGISAPLLGAAKPLFFTVPPQGHKEIPGSGPSAAGHRNSEPANSSLGVHPSPFSKSTLSTQGFQSSLSPSNQKVNGGDLVMLDRKLVPSKTARDEQFLPRPEQELTSTKLSVSSAWVPPIENVRTNNQTDGTYLTSGLSAFSHTNKASSLNTTLEHEKGSMYSAVNSSSSTLPSSSGIKTPPTGSERSDLLYAPVSEATSPKHLRPPPLFQPPITTSTFKPEPFLPPALNNVSSFGFSSSSTLSSTKSSTTSVLDNALLRPSAPLTFQFPAPVSAIYAPYENGNSELVDSLKTVLPRSHSTAGQIPSQPIRVAEPVDKSGQLWPQSSVGDDFAMLEQHIEDLTQEKFSLQRGLESARTLADTLARENSALTEDYNNQGALVNDLKAEIERLQGEIRAQAVVVKNMNAERNKAVQESSTATERSQALAAEVIALEEKVLRARSQELKLQREMELLGAESESQKRQISSLDKDRVNSKTLMDALQEEKGLLQAQVRKANAGGTSGDLRHNVLSSTVESSARAKADACTSTTDIEWETYDILGEASTAGPLSASHNRLAQGQLMGSQPLEQHRRLPMIIPSLPSRPLLSPSHAGQASGSFSLPNEGGPGSQFFSVTPGTPSGRGLNLGPVSTVIPPDQAATVVKIDTLITELAEEKEALLKALRAESVGAAELRTLNSELSHKLEVQTQRLELAVAQSMAHGSTPRIGSTYAVSRMAPEYVDEGDEVVDRVLGWIMQLFPSGSSRRKRL